MTQYNLPFEVGQTVEVRSFELGFRGAWFRCKILKIFKKNRALFYDVEYLDYPGEGIHTTKVFQQLEGGSKKYLMIRPVYPRKCHEIEVLNKEGGLEEVLVVRDCWKVGDLVDWWTDYCYWSGTVLKVQENDSVQIELLPPPYGEGSIYEDALSKDLRPSLEWSLEDSWTVPFSKDGEKRQCAELMKLLNDDQVSEAESREEEKHRGVESREEEKHRGVESREEEKQSGVESEFMEEETQSGAESREEEKHRPTENLLKSDEVLRLNIMESESVEAAVLDLEELIVRFEWMKGLLPNSLEKSSWEYEDYRPSSSSI